MKNHRAIALLAVAAMTAMSACGDDDESTADDTSAPTTPATAPEEPATTTPPPTEPATTHPGGHPSTTPDSEPGTTTAVEDEVLTIVLSDFAFGGLPESVPAGTKLAVENTSDAELHELLAFRVNEGETRTAEELAALPEPELFQAVAPVPTTVLLAAPGGPQIDALGDGTLAEPGRYLILCGIPTGVDPEEYLAAAAGSDGPPDVQGGPPHFAHGMFADLVVE